MLFASKYKIRLYHAEQTEPFLLVYVMGQHVQIVSHNIIKIDSAVLTFADNIYAAVDEVLG